MAKPNDEGVAIVPIQGNSRCNWKKLIDQIPWTKNLWIMFQLQADTCGMNGTQLVVLQRRWVIRGHFWESSIEKLLTMPQLLQTLDHRLQTLLYKFAASCGKFKTLLYKFATSCGKFKTLPGKFQTFRQSCELTSHSCELMSYGCDYILQLAQRYTYGTKSRFKVYNL